MPSPPSPPEAPGGAGSARRAPGRTPFPSPATLCGKLPTRRVRLSRAVSTRFPLIPESDRPGRDVTPPWRTGSPRDHAPASPDPSGAARRDASPADRPVRRRLPRPGPWLQCFNASRHESAELPPLDAMAAGRADRRSGCGAAQGRAVRGRDRPADKRIRDRGAQSVAGSRHERGCTARQKGYGPPDWRPGPKVGEIPWPASPPVHPTPQLQPTPAPNPLPLTPKSRRPCATFSGRSPR